MQKATRGLPHGRITASALRAIAGLSPGPQRLPPPRPCRPTRSLAVRAPLSSLALLLCWQVQHNLDRRMSEESARAVIYALPQKFEIDKWQVSLSAHAAVSSEHAALPGPATGPDRARRRRPQMQTPLASAARRLRSPLPPRRFPVRRRPRPKGFGKSGSRRSTASSTRWRITALCRPSRRGPACRSTPSLQSRCASRRRRLASPTPPIS
eukprot:scaffold5748_cov124-Isochrysis_galbana.AAC.2